MKQPRQLIGALRHQFFEVIAVALQFGLDRLAAADLDRQRLVAVLQRALLHHRTAGVLFEYIGAMAQPVEAKRQQQQERRKDTQRIQERRRRQ